MILVDTSAWVELLRRTGSRAHLELRALIADDPVAIATCEPIEMELLAGPTDPFTVRRIEDQLGTLDGLALEPAEDYRAAAALARAVRRSGNTVRSLNDCLIAAVAIRHDAVLWHCDADYGRIGEVAELDHRDLR